MQVMAIIVWEAVASVSRMLLSPDDTEVLGFVIIVSFVFVAAALFWAFPRIYEKYFQPVRVKLERLHRGERFAEAEVVLRKAIAREERRTRHPNPQELRWLYRELGCLLLEHLDEFEAGEAAFRQRLALEEEQHGPDSPELLDSMAWIAWCLQATGRDAELAEVGRRIVAIVEQQHGSDSLPVAGELNKLGLTLARLQRWEEAEAAHRRSLALREQLDDDAFILAVCLFNLAQALAGQAKHKEAAEVVARCIASESQAGEQDHDRHDGKSFELLCDAHCFHGELLVLMGSFEAAAKEFRAALAMNAKGQGGDRLHILNKLGNALLLHGDWEAAEAIARQELSERESAQGPEHLDMSDSLQALALVLRSQRRFAEAEELCRRSLAIQQKHLPEGDARLGEARYKLALLVLDQERLDEGEALLRTALESLETRGDSVVLTSALFSLSKTMSLRSNHAEAERLLWRIIEIEERLYGLEHPELAVTMTEIARLREVRGDTAGAEAMLRQALALFESTNGRDSVQVADCALPLGRMLMGRDAVGEAELLMRRALAIYETQPVPMLRQVSSATLELARLLQHTGRPAESEQLFRRAISMGGRQGAAGQPVVALANAGLASILEHMGDYAGARVVYLNAVAAAVTAFGAEHPTTLSLREHLDKLLFAGTDPHVN